MTPGGRFVRDDDDSGLAEMRAIDGLEGPVESPHEHDPTDHLALIYESQAEQFETIVPFIRQGLAQGDRCVYIVHDNAKADLVAALGAAGVDVDAALESGQLTLRTAQEVYFEDGEFDPERMLSTVEEMVADARSDGVRLRATGEMTWLLEGGVDARDVFTYESELTDLLSGSDVIGVCQYNRSRIPDTVVRDVINTHPHLISENTISPNVYYTPADEIDEFATGDEHVEDHEQPAADAGDVEDGDRSAATRGVPDDDREDVDTILQSLRNYAEAHVTLEEQERFLRDLYDIASASDRSFQERIEAILDLGCAYFDLDFGALTHISSVSGGDIYGEGAEIEYDLEVVAGDVPEEFESGPPAEPESGCFCREAITEDRPVGAADVRETAWKEDRLYQEYGLTAYFGVKVDAGAEPHGTLWFGSREPRADPFGDAEYTLLELIGQWVSYEIERRERERLLRRQSEITTVPDHSFEEKLRALFDLGCERFGLELGAMARVDPATDLFEITHTSQDHDYFEPGLELPLSETFCTVPSEGATVTAPDENAVEDISIYRKFGLKTYLGTYVKVDGAFDRTLFFVSSGSRTEPFSAGERGFLQLLGQWAKYELERRAREERLATMTTLSRTLQDAETATQVCDRIVAVADSLEAPVLAVALREDDALQWQASTDEAEALIDARPALTDALARRALEEAEYQREPEPLERPGTDPAVTEAVALPMGTHGALLAGTFVPGGFSLSDIDVLVTLASQAGAALTRARREQKLQERETQLQAQNETLGRLNRINELVQNIVRAFVTEPTRSEIQQTVCDRLSTAEFYEAAWIGERSLTSESLTPSAAAGIDADRLSEQSTEDAFGLANRALDDEEIQVVEDPPVPATGPLAADGIESALAVPITYKDTVHGALVVYADHRFDERQQSILADLGETLGFALTAVDRKRALITDEAVRLEITVSEQSHFFISVTAETDATIELQGAIPQADGSTLVYNRVVGEGLETVLERAEQDDAIQHARIVDDGAEDALVEFVVSEALMIDTFGEYGATVADAVASDGQATIAVELPSTVDVRALVEAFQEQFPDSELVSKRSVDRPVQTAAGFRAALTDCLTEKQRTVLRAAYLAGYFERPRASAGGEIADTLGLSSSTFHQHLRVALRKLLYAAFDEHSMP